MPAKPIGEYSIAKLGRDNIQLDRPTKLKFKQLAGDQPLVGYLRELADRELSKRQGELIPIENTIASVKHDTKEAVSLLKALSIAFSKWNNTPEQVELLKRSPLHMLTDDEIKETIRELSRALRNRKQKSEVKLFNHGEA